MVLHADKGCELVCDGVVLHGVDYAKSASFAQEVSGTRTLPGEAAAHANVPHFSALDDVVQRLHGLLNGCVIIEAMALQYVHKVKL